jgi:hypothetical protein
VNTERIRDRFLPWSGLALGTTGYFITHQLGSDSVFQDCRAGSPAMVIVAMLVGLAIVGLGAFGSWRVYSGEGDTPARHLVAVVSLLACALFALAIVLPFIASLVIPQCWA